MAQISGRHNFQPSKLTPFPAEAFGPAGAPLVASAVHTDDPTLRRAATWLVRRVRPALAATVAAHAGLGGRHHG